MTQLAENLLEETVSGTLEEKHQKTIFLRNWLSATLTARGALIMAFAVILLTGPVSRRSDVVAAVSSFSLLAMIALIAAITAIRGNSLSHILGISLFWESGAGDSLNPGGELLSQHSIRLVGRLSPFRLPPLYALTMQLHLARPGVRTSLHRLSGSSEEERLIVEDLIFPHRGQWIVESVHFFFGDCLGFCRFEWEIYPAEGLSGVLVGPPEVVLDTLPVLSSCSRSGDELEDRFERRGDYFDLKQYHPSDGIKKILWKVFAKSGELISRHPERSMSPEGEVLIFCLADHREDHVCGALLGYIRHLLDLDLQVLTGCEGSGAEQAGRTLEECRSLLIESVWETGKDTAEPVLFDLNALLKSSAGVLPSARLERLIIFASPLRLASMAGLEQLVKCGELLNAAGIAPVYFMVNQPGVPPENFARTKPPEHAIPGWHMGAGLRNLLFQPATTSGQISVKYYSEFINTCAGRNWEVFAS